MHDHTPSWRASVRRREVAILVVLISAASFVLTLDARATELARDDVSTAAADQVTPAPPPYATFATLEGAQDALPDEVDDPVGDATVTATLRSENRLDQARERRAAREQRFAIWARLADCESGAWGRNGQPIPGSARWDYGSRASHRAIYEGGLQFHPNTWDRFRLAGMPGHAGQATPEQQVAVAERVLVEQGWGAWPRCSRKLGYR